MGSGGGIQRVKIIGVLPGRGGRSTMCNMADVQATK